MSATLALNFSIAALSLSALSWLVAAVTAPVITQSYFDHLPATLIRRQKVAGYANAIGALLAAIGVALQAYASL